MSLAGEPESWKRRGGSSTDPSVVGGEATSFKVLLQKLEARRKHVDVGLITRAFDYADKAHCGQFRRSGEPYVTHPLAVACILADMRVDDLTIAGALLHDTIEDTNTSRKELSERFGEPLALIVDSLTKIDRLNLENRANAQAENVRKLLLAIAVDVRVLLIKLCDRLHNMQTLRHLSLPRQQSIAQETMEIYAPLAGRMGMNAMREELEDLAFQHINPRIYSMIAERLVELREEFAGNVSQIAADLESHLGPAKPVSISGREKRPYSIWRKMERKSLSFEMLSDIYGFRVIVPNVRACYRALGIIHTTWQAVPGRFKDHISAPKQNDYRSLHTTIVGSGSERIELQIRSTHMHAVAEFGVAAHTDYKDGTGRSTADRRLRQSHAYARLRKTLHHLTAEDASPEELLENTKMELYLDQVFCFTPKGRLIALPRGATPIDFAYAVHTNVGNTCVGCKISGRPSPLTSALRNGDEVEILRNPDGGLPPASWLESVITGKARASIRRTHRIFERERDANLGRHIMQLAFEHAGKTYSDGALAPARHAMQHPSVEQLLAEIGTGEIESASVLKLIFPDYRSERRRPDAQTARTRANSLVREGWIQLGTQPGIQAQVPKDPASGISVHTLQHAPVRLEPEIGALPGERIAGLMGPEGEITIIPSASPLLMQHEASSLRWVALRWDPESAPRRRYPARIWVTSINAPGSLAAIATVIAENDANIENMTMFSRSADFHVMILDLDLWSIGHLNNTLLQLRALRNLHRAERSLGKAPHPSQYGRCPLCASGLNASIPSRALRDR